MYGFTKRDLREIIHLLLDPDFHVNVFLAALFVLQIFAVLYYLFKRLG